MAEHSETEPLLGRPVKRRQWYIKLVNLWICCLGYVYSIHQMQTSLDSDPVPESTQAPSTPVQITPASNLVSTPPSLSLPSKQAETESLPQQSTSAPPPTPARRPPSKPIAIPRNRGALLA